MSNVNLITALVAGVLALLSPCSALLLPSFFAYAFSSRRALIARTTAFYLGLLITLVPLGSGAAAVSTVVYGHRHTLILVSGWAIIAIGTLQLLGGTFRIPGASRLQTWASQHGAGRGGYISTLALGAVYGLAGFCSGPVLGAILTVAATSGSPLSGGFLLAVYALGMATPLFILAWFWDRFKLGDSRWLRGRTLAIGPLRVHTSAAIAGILFISIGILFLRYDGTAGLTGSFGLGDTTALETQIQEGLTSATADIPAWTLPVLIFIVSVIIAWRRIRNREHGKNTTEEGSRVEAESVRQQTERTPGQ